MYHKEKLFIIISGLFILLASIGFGITLIIDHALNGKHDLINELQTKLDSANRDRRASNDRIIYARIFRNALDSFYQDRDDMELRKSRKKEFIADLRIAASLMFCAAHELQEISDAELKALSTKISEIDSPDELYNYKWKYSLVAADGERKLESEINDIKLSIQTYKTSKLLILILSIFLNSVGLLFGILSIRYQGNTKDT
jgi:hypothetical protein